MGIWIDSNGQSWDINMEGRALAKMQRNPDFKFCWMKASLGIDDESNLNFYHEETIGEQKGQRVNKVVTVNCSAGRPVSGRVSPWVNGPCCGTPLKNWFIICTKD